MMSSSLYIEEKAVTHEKRITRAYLRELVGSLAVYFVLVALAVAYGKSMTEGALRTVLLVSPMVGFGLMILAIARQLARKDEYQRMRLLENIAIGAAITAGATFTYGFLETAGFPRLSMFTVWCVLAGSTGAAQCLRKLLNR
jgi:peptidoglycan/LPS O-acetylase OafA/YrhL